MCQIGIRVCEEAGGMVGGQRKDERGSGKPEQQLTPLVFRERVGERRDDRFSGGAEPWGIGRRLGVQFC